MPDWETVSQPLNLIRDRNLALLWHTKLRPALSNLEQNQG